MLSLSVMPMRTVTVKVDDQLKKKMGAVPMNWSEYIRESIRRRVELEERRRAAEELLKSFRSWWFTRWGTLYGKLSSKDL